MGPSSLHPRTGAHRRRRGMTLVEVTVALALVGIMVAAAMPSHLAQLQRARRMDATAALTRMQYAQEQYRAMHGRYSADLVALTGAAAPRSAEGLYQLAVLEADGDSVVLAARPRPEGAQRSDRECAEITLRLNQGLADPGPSGRCWSQ